MLQSVRHATYITILAAVVFTVSAAAADDAASISVSPSEITVDYVVGSGRSSFAYTVAVQPNRAGTALAFRTRPDSGSTWLSSDSTAYVAPGTFTLTVDAGNVSAGIYRGHVDVIAGDTLATVPVVLRVRERPTVVARPSVLTFSYQQGAPTPATQNVSVTGGKTQFSTSTLTYVGGSWLHATLGWADSSVTASSLRVDVEPAGLDPGTYTGSVVIRAPEAANPEVVVPVTLTVTADAEIVATPSALFLEAQTGASQSPSASLTVNTNGVIFQIRPTTTVPWLTASPSVVSVGLCDGDKRAAVPQSAVLAVTADASSLSPGVYRTTVQLSRGGGPPAAVIPVTLTVRARGLIVPQVADGAGWKTSILLVNTDREPAPFTVRFIGADGGPLTLPIESVGPITEISGVIPVGGSQAINTSGGADAKQGWAKVTAGKALAGTVVFRQRTADGDSEAGVSVAAPIGNQMSIPFDSADGFVTAIAVVNPGASPTVLNATLRNENGQMLSTETIALGQESRKAFVISDLWPAAKNQRGAVTFTSSAGDLAGFGLRVNPMHAFTAVQALPPAVPQAEPVSRSIAQIADGGNWKTTIILVNNSAVKQPFSVVFRDAYGGPLSLPIVGVGPVSEYADVIPPGGIRMVESEGSGQMSLQGSAEIVSPYPVMGTAIFGPGSQTGLHSEGAVQIASSAGDRLVVPFDNAHEFLTALAILNESSSSNAIAVTIRDGDGQIITTRSIPLNAHERRAFATATEFQGTSGRSGTIELSGAKFSVLSLRFNPRGGFTSIAPAPK